MHQQFRVLLALLLAIALSATTPAQDQARQPQQPKQQQKQSQQKQSLKQHPQSHDSAMQVPTHAVAVLIPTQGNKVKGEIVLTQKGDVVHITGRVTNLTPGEHGFHIHQYGDLRSADGTSAGGHFSPEGHQHGGPDDSEHHAGDLGNITANPDGVATIDKQSKTLKLHLTLGRAVVVHADADDFKSQPSGAAGARVAVGVIGIANVEDQQPQSKK